MCYQRCSRHLGNEEFLYTKLTLFSDKLKVEIKHDLEFEAEISYVEPLLSAVKKIGALQAGESGGGGWELSLLRER